MSLEIAALKDTIAINRQEMADQILTLLGIDEIEIDEFQDILATIMEYDIKRDKYLKALEGQVIVDSVLKDKLL